MMKIRTMEARDVARVAELEKLCFADPWSERSVESELDNPLSLWLVAEEDGTVIGYVGSQTVLGESDMMNLAVDVPFRGKGVARALVRALMDSLRASGAVCLTLEVRTSNLAARALYEGLSFARIGTRPGYYFHPREDAEIYRIELGNAI